MKSEAEVKTVINNQKSLLEYAIENSGARECASACLYAADVNASSVTYSFFGEKNANLQQ